MEETHDEQDPSSRGVYGATGALRDVLEAWCPPEADPWKCNHGESRDTFAIRVAGLIERRESALGRPSGLTIEGLWSQAMKAESEAFRRRRGTREDFWLVASEAWQRGWQVVPQDRDAKRLPGLIRGGGRVRWGEYTTRRQTSGDVDGAIPSCPGHNTAIVTGPACAGVFAVDCDLEGGDAAVVRRLADEHLGATPFERTRMSTSRWMRLYRGDGVATRKLATLAGDVEILGQSRTGTGSLVTAFGLHGKDKGRLPVEEWHRGEFEWTTSPRRAPPTDAGVVDAAMLDAFEAALFAEFGRPEVAAAPRVVEPARFDGRLLVPGGAQAVPGVTYDGGLAVDGRVAYVQDRTYAWYVHNPDAPLVALVAQYMVEARANVRMGGRWLRMEDEARQQFAQLRRKHRAARLPMRRLHVGEDGAVYTAVDVTPVASSDQDVAALAGARRTPVRIAASTPPTAALAAERGFADEGARRVETTRVALAVRDGIQAWLDALWAGDDESAARLASVWLMIAPTGAGKTTTFLRLLADQVERRGPLLKSVVLMLPSYANIGEAEVRLAELGDQAKGVGLRSVVYKGKVAGGCLVADQMRKLMDAGIGTAGLCEADVEVREPSEGRATVTETCVHADVCPVLANRREAEDCDLLLMPMAFLSLAMRKSIRDTIAAVVVDERCWTEFVEHRTFPLDALTLPRGGVYATESEVDDVLHPGETDAHRKRRRKAVRDGTVVLTDAQRAARKRAREDAISAMHHDREAIAAVVSAALREGRRVGQAVLDHRVTYGGQTVTGLTMAENAKRVCGRAADRRKSVRPNMTDLAISDLVDAPRGSWLWHEAAFWSVVLDDCERLKDGSAKGKVDARLQLLDRGVRSDATARDAAGHPVCVGESIRVSWRKNSVLASKPSLLLDASASPEIVEKLWGGCQVTVIRIDARLHMRVVWCPDLTWSDSSYVPSKAGIDDEAKRVAASRQMYAVRNVATVLGGLFGHGMVSLCATKAGRYAIEDGWQCPGNVRSMHFGAVAGLDFARFDLAALCVGRMEVPVRVIDAVVGALTYDDETPELPIDRRGDGLGDDGKPYKPARGLVTVPMRDGSDISVVVPMHAGHWARIVQRQMREENQRQFIGRLRPVYRVGEPPLVLLMSSVIPDGIVVDEVVHSQDLQVHYRLWESVRRRKMLEPYGVSDGDLRSPGEGVHGEWQVLASAVAELKAKGVDGCRIGRGLVQCTAFFKGGARRWLYLPAWADTDQFRRQYMEYWRDEELIAVSVVKRGAPVAPSEPRPHDVAFEAAVGTWEDRGIDERVDRVESARIAIETMASGDQLSDMRIGPERGPMGVATIVRRSRRRSESWPAKRSTAG